MTTVILDQLTQDLATTFNQGPGEEEQFGYLFPQLLLLLAKGHPVSPEEIASITGQSCEEVMTYLPQLPNVELDEAGNLVGMGLTLKPTPHRFEVEGRTLYTWCALDALLFPALLEKPAVVTSPCAVTGVPVSVSVIPDKVIEVKPEEAVVSIVKSPTMENIRGSFCHHVHFFASAEAAAVWLPQHPDTVLLSVAEAYQLGQVLSQEMFNIFAVTGASCE